MICPWRAASATMAPEYIVEEMRRGWGAVLITHLLVGNHGIGAGYRMVESLLSPFSMLNAGKVSWARVKLILGRKAGSLGFAVLNDRMPRVLPSDSSLFFKVIESSKGKQLQKRNAAGKLLAINNASLRWIQNDPEQSARKNLAQYPETAWKLIVVIT